MPKVKAHTFKIPHIAYTVVVEHKQKGDREGAWAYTKKMSNSEAVICIPLPIKGAEHSSYLVHEIVHVLQHICEGSHMNFLEEREHMAYIADWLFVEINKL